MVEYFQKDNEGRVWPLKSVPSTAKATTLFYECPHPQLSQSERVQWSFRPGARVGT